MYLCDGLYIWLQSRLESLDKCSFYLMVLTYSVSDICYIGVHLIG